MRSFKLLFTFLALCSATMVQAQLSNVTYWGRMNAIQSYNACANDGQLNPTAIIYFADNANGAEQSICYAVDGTNTYGFNGAEVSRTNQAVNITSRILSWEHNTAGRCSYEGTSVGFTPDNCLFQPAAVTAVSNFRAHSAPSGGSYAASGTFGTTVSPGHTYSIQYSWRYASGGSAITPDFVCTPSGAPTFAYSAGQIASWTVNTAIGGVYNISTSAAAEIRVYNSDGYTVLTSTTDGPGGITFTANSTIHFIELSGSGRTNLGVGGSLSYSRSGAGGTSTPTYGINTWNSYGWNGVDLNVYRGILTNDYLVARNSNRIAYGWGNNAPITDCAPMNADNFSTRHMMQRNFTAGYYTFTYSADDGMRISVDGGATWFINNWTSSNHSSNGTAYLSGIHNVIVDHRENGGAAGFDVQICYAGPGTAYGVNTWRSFAYDGVDFNRYRGEITSGASANNINNVNYQWGSGAPAVACGMPSADNFSTMHLMNRDFAAGYYLVSYASDDGIRISLDGGSTFPVNNFGNNTVSGSFVTFISGNRNVRVDHREATGGAAINVSFCQMDGGDLSGYGSGNWKVYDYNTNNYNFSGANYRGTFTTGSANASGASFGALSNGAVAAATNANGANCGVGGSGQSIRALANQTFNKGIYTVSIGSDDNYRIFFNGTQYLSGGCCAGVSGTFALEGNYNIEYQGNNGGGGGANYYATISCASPLAGSLSSNQGCGATGAATISWSGGRGYYILQSSTNGTTWSNLTSELNTQSNPTYSISQNPSVTTFYRMMSSSCGSTVYSNVAAITRSSGTNLTIANNVTLGGTITLTGDFTVNSGVTVTVPQGCELVVNAANITINGTINANGAGYAGGNGGAGGAGQNRNGAGAGGGGGGGLAGEGTGGGNAGSSGTAGGVRDGSCGTACIGTYRDWYNGGGGGGGAGAGASYGGSGAGSSWGAGGTGFSVAGGGSNGDGGSAKSTYGNASDLNIGFGSGGGGGGGGGGGWSAGGSGGSGGNGGGAVSLLASGNLSVAGTITANGTNGQAGGNGGGISTSNAYNCSASMNQQCGGGLCSPTGVYGAPGGAGAGAGGGSGGGIKLQAFGNTVVTGVLSAIGGAGGAAGLPNPDYGGCFAYAAGGGGGGGGRIKVIINPCAANNIAGSFAANGGSGGSYYGGTWSSGASGSVVTNILHPSYTPLVALTASPANQEICYNQQPLTNLTVTPQPPTGALNGGYTYQWYRSTTTAVGTTGTGSTPASGWAAISGATGATLTSAQMGNLTTSTWYQVRLNSGICYSWSGVSKVTVDETPPVASCKPHTAVLNAGGTTSISTGDINNGSTDNCGIASLSLNNSSFTCANLGANTVTLTVTDTKGNTATCNATVTVADNTAPVLAGCPSNIILSAPTGSCSAVATYSTPTATDNCSVTVSRTAGLASGSAFPVGVTTVTHTATDAGGNSVSCSFTVTVNDVEAPVITCPVSQVVNASANCVATMNYAAATATDNCSVSSVQRISGPASGTPLTLGTETITFRASDPSGNTDDCSFTIEYRDITPPTVSCRPATAVLDANGQGSITVAAVEQTSNDNCGITAKTVYPNTFDCNNVGFNSVTLTVSDASGNSTSCTSTVTVQDATAPTALCVANHSIVLELDVNGQASLTVGEVDNGSYDNCGIGNRSISPSTFNCASDGDNTVFLFVTDVNGLFSVCQTIVTVLDVNIPGEAPRTSCIEALDIYLDEGGFAQLFPYMLDDGNSYDNCGLDLTLDQEYFDCSYVGSTVTVEMTGIDPAGNQASCTSEVTILDITPPFMFCNDLYIELDDNGEAYISAWDLDGGSYDNCEIDYGSFYTDQEIFTCDNLGENWINLYAADIYGNWGECTALVYVEDFTPPIAYCVDYVTVYLDETGVAYLSVDEVEAGSYDNCEVFDIYLTQSEFYCYEVGEVYIDMVVVDQSYNESYCSVVVQVVDEVAPEAICADIIIQLDEYGYVEIAEYDIDGGSYDNCEVAYLEASQLAFDCISVGDNVVTLTVYDVNGNVSTSCDATVTVEDVTAPEIISCAGDVAVFNDPTVCGAALIFDLVVADDACGIASIVNDFNGTADASDFYPVGTTVVEFTVTDVNGNASTCSFTVEVEDNEAPVITACPADKFRPAAAGRCWALVTIEPVLATDNCGIASIVNSKNGTSNASGQYDVGITQVDWTVTDIHGNESTCETYILVIDGQPPVALCRDLTVALNNSGFVNVNATSVDNGSTDNCTIISRQLSQNFFTCSDLGANTVSLTVIDNSGNVGTCTATITVEDNIAPVASCRNVNVFLNAQGGAVVSASDANNASFDACGTSFSLSKTAFDCSDLGQNSVTLTVTDPSNNSSACIATVMVYDITAPVAECNTLTVELDEDGQILLSPAALTVNSYDNCDITNMVAIPGSLNCSNLGNNNVTVLLTDQSGNTSFCSTVVEVVDVISPTITCPDDISTFTDLSQCGAVVYYFVGVTDNCTVSAQGMVTGIPSGQSFPVGFTTVEYTAVDQSGNVSICSFEVEVIDVELPIAICSDIIVELNIDGNITIIPEDVDAGSIDACGITLVLSQTEFNCSEVGNNVVTLTVTDPSGNESTCDATVTVEDIVQPIAACQDVVVQLDASGNGSTTAEAVDNGSNDACGISNLALSQTAFNCSHVGANDVILTVIDNNGNISTCVAVVTVEDNVAPVAVCEDVTVQLGADGNGSTTAAAVGGFSNDACGIASLSLSQYNFICSEVGGNTVTLTVIDNNGNTSTCDATVTVEDKVAPVAICQNVTVQLDATGNGSTTAAAVNNNSTDACGIAGLSLNQTAFNCSHIGGANLVILTVTDVNGNSSTCFAGVTVEDNVAPVAVCQDISFALDPSGNATIVPGQINDGSNDACGIPTYGYSLDISSFTCEDVGDNTVTLTVVDNNGNSSTCTAVVTIEDVSSPDAKCKNVSLFLNEDGDAILDPMAVNDNSMDACGLLPQCPPGSPAGSCLSGLSLDITYFGCPEVGPNTVTLTVTDVNLNSSSCTATVTVFDQIAPVAECQNVTVQLNASGNGSTTAAAVDNGSNDACGIATLSLSKTAFNCSNVGGNTVTLTATDVNGNSSACTATVTVQDNVAPVASCRSAVVTLSQGVATVTPVQVDDNSTDACGIASRSVSPNTWTCNDIGEHTVTLTVTDVNGNSSTCQAVVEVYGSIPDVEISSSLLPNFCQGGQMILTATPNEPVSFAWSNGYTSNDINVYASGLYSVVVTNDNGCTNSDSYHVEYNASIISSSYTIIATKELHLHGNINVLNGGVGLTSTDNKDKLRLHDKTMVTGPTTFVTGISIETTGTSAATTRYNYPANVALPPFVSNPYPGTFDVKVPDNATVTLSDSVYKKIEIGRNATVTFTRPTVFAQEVLVREGARVKFNACANMVIKKKIAFEKNAKFNLEQNGVTVYVQEGGDAVVFSEGTQFIGKVYAPNGNITSSGGKVATPTLLTGQFIGYKVEFMDYTTINWDLNCDVSCYPSAAPDCICLGGINALTMEYSLSDEASPLSATVTFYSNAALTNVIKVFKKIEPGKVINLSANNLPGKIFGPFVYAVVAENPDSVIVIPTSCGSDIIGDFFNELFVYSQKDLYKSICATGTQCGPGKAAMCHDPNKNKNMAHTHCVKVKHVAKKSQHKHWSVGPCTPTPASNAREIEPVATYDWNTSGRVDETMNDVLFIGTMVELDAAPNPFKQSTMIRFRVPQDDQVKLVVFGVTGQEIERLYEGAVEGGRAYSFDFQAGNHASGMYFYRLETSDGKVHVKKLIITK
jgi:hypothetical protein